MPEMITSSLRDESVKTDTLSTPRAKTVEEVRAEFFGHIRGIVQHEATAPGPRTVAKRCLAVAHSILTLLDGCQGMPSMNILLCPHEEDEEFDRRNGRNWYQRGMVINDRVLHDEFAELYDEEPQQPTAREIT